jgi:hypothetical protein
VGRPRSIVALLALASRMKIVRLVDLLRTERVTKASQERRLVPIYNASKA